MTIHWSSGARHDLARIFAFNAGYNADRAAAIDGRLVEAGTLIARNPLLGRRIGQSNVRERSLSDIQYVVRYRIDANDAITILSVRHTREQQQEKP